MLKFQAHLSLQPWSFYLILKIIQLFNLYITCLFFWSEFLDDGDILEHDYVASGDYLKQQEEELKLRVELEAEERKLEETLEYQRRIEDEAKQKHLAEQLKNSTVTSPNNKTEERFAADSVLNLNYDSILHNYIAPNFVEGIEFGDFHFSEANVHKSHHDERFNESKNKPAAADQLLNLEQQQNIGDNSDKLNDIYISEVQDFGHSNGLPSKGGLQMNGIERRVSDTKFSNNSSAQKAKKTSGQSHMKYKQGCILFPFRQRQILVWSTIFSIICQ